MNRFFKDIPSQQLLDSQKREIFLVIILQSLDTKKGTDQDLHEHNFIHTKEKPLPEACTEVRLDVSASCCVTLKKLYLSKTESQRFNNYFFKTSEQAN